MEEKERNQNASKGFALSGSVNSCALLRCGIVGKGIKSFVLNLLSLINLLNIQAEMLQRKDTILELGEMSGLEI